MSRFAFCPCCNCEGCARARRQYLELGLIPDRKCAEEALHDLREQVAPLAELYSAALREAMLGDDLLVANDAVWELLEACRQFTMPDAPPISHQLARRRELTGSKVASLTDWRAMRRP